MPYEVTDHRTYKINDDGERSLLANFAAKIVKETRYLDGRTVDSYLDIIGSQQAPDGKGTVALPKTTVRSTEFASMGWVLGAWGVRAVISPGNLVKDDLRATIQLTSTPELEEVYKHLGWQTIKGQRVFLHAEGGMREGGNDHAVSVSLPHELQRFVLPDPPKRVKDLQKAVQAVLDLSTIGPPAVAWTLLAAAVCPLHGPVDFAVHLTGRTGTFKSELMSLFQSFYGVDMDARHLPGSWSSTANAIEAQAYLAANVPFVVDDFVPAGTSWQIRSYQTTADKIIRSQGNQAGRARLTDTSSLQATMYPRGIILSTGEDTPDGHSVRARMMILELAPGEIDAKALSHAQAARPLYSQAVAAYVQHLCKKPLEDVATLAAAERDKLLDLGHARTPAMVGRLLVSLGEFLTWCEQFVGKPKVNTLRKEAAASIKKAGGSQLQYLESADPIDIFTSALRTIFATGLGHVRTTNGGIPRGAETLGWTILESSGDIPTYKSRGPCIGWISWKSGEIFLDVNAGYALARKVAGHEISLSRNTFIKRLKDAGMLTRTDQSRQRNTVRISAENHPRQVLAMPIMKVLDTQELPQDKGKTSDKAKDQPPE